MATSASGYGVYNPNAVDPFPIEQTLAQIVGTNNPAQAGNLLDSYRVKNMVASDNYDYALNQQHDFAKQQLQQQLYEANLKGLAEAKDPTVLQLMAGNPTYSGVLGDNRANIADALGRSQRVQSAGVFKNVGEGISSARAGGAMPDIGGLNTQYGLNLSPVDPTSIEAAKIRASATLGAAKIHAEPMPSESMLVKNPYGTVSTLNKPGKMTDEAFAAYLKKRGMVPVDDQGNTIPLPTTAATPPPTTPVAPASAPSATRTNAPPASSGGGIPKNEQAGAPAAQQQILANIDKLQREHKPVYDDIKAGIAKNGGRPMVEQDANGRWHAKGASGQVY